MATGHALVFYQLGMRTCCSYSYSPPSLMNFAFTPYLPFLLLPILLHSNPLSSYLLFRPHSPVFLSAVNQLLDKDPGVTLYCPLFPATAQRKRGPKNKWHCCCIWFACACSRFCFKDLSHVYCIALHSFACGLRIPESRAKVKSNSGKESKHWSLIRSAYYESSRESRSLIR